MVSIRAFKKNLLPTISDVMRKEKAVSLETEYGYKSIVKNFIIITFLSINKNYTFKGLCILWGFIIAK